MKYSALPRWIRFRRARVLGASLYVHWSVLLVVALLALMSFQSPIHAAVSIAAYLALILIHELGHALVASRLGYRVFAIRVSCLHGECELDAPHTEVDHVLIAWAGVLAQLAVALPVLAVATLTEDFDLGYAAPAIVFLGYVNLLVALVNLAPSPEFDGHVAWRVIRIMKKRWSSRASALQSGRSKRVRR